MQKRIQKGLQVSGAGRCIVSFLGSKPAFLNPNHSATRFLPQPAIFGSRMKSNPI